MIQLFYQQYEIKQNDENKDINDTMNDENIKSEEEAMANIENQVTNNHIIDDDIEDDKTSNLSSANAGTDLLRKKSKKKPKDEKKPLAVLMEQLPKNKESGLDTVSCIIRTNSHVNTLNHEQIELEMIYQDNPSILIQQWRVFFFSFLFSSIITITQYFIPILHNAPIFGNVASVYLWNIDFC